MSPLISRWDGFFLSIDMIFYSVNLIKRDGLSLALRIVPRKFTGIGSVELFSGNSQEFSQILLTFSPFLCRIGNKKFPGIGYKKFLWHIYEKFPRMGYEKFLEIAVDIFTGF